MKSKSNFFLSSLLLSLVGNSISDYALLWYSIKVAGQSTSLFFIGQALGVILLAPLLSVLLDRWPKKWGSIILDCAYGLILLAVILISTFSTITAPIIFIVAMCLKAGSTLHNSSVVYSGLHSISNKENKSRLVTNYVATLTTSNALGMAISGIIYESFSLEACLAIGIVTFIPALFSYFVIFKNEDEIQDNQKVPYFQSLKEGSEFLFKDKVLLWSVLSISIFNIAGGLIPVMLGISLKNSNIGSGNLFGIILGAGLLIGVALKNHLEKFARASKINMIIPITVGPCLILVITSIWVNHPLVYTILYFIACSASYIRNLSTGALRLERIPKHLYARVNTAYSVFLFSGQIIGGAVFIPAFQNSPTLGSSIAAIVFFVSLVISAIKLPQIKLATILESTK